MISPTIAAIIAATSTAPAAVSLAVLASGFRSVVTKSTTDSIAVLTSSRAITSPNSVRQMHHSVGVIPSTAPAITTSIATVQCILILRSFLMHVNMPLEGIAEAFVQRWFLCFFHVDTSRDLILELVLMPFTMVLLYNFLVQNKRGLCNIVQKIEVTDSLNNFYY